MGEDRMFMGGLILDLSDKTDKTKPRDFLNLMMYPFEHSGVRDLIQEDAAELGFTSRLATEGDVISGFSFLAANTPLHTINLQNKNSRVTSTAAGFMDNIDEVEKFFQAGRYAPSRIETDVSAMLGQMMLRVNTPRHIADAHLPDVTYENYTHRVKTRISDALRGVWSGVSVFSSRQRSTVVIMARDQPVYFTTAVVDSCLILLWSNVFDAVNQILNGVKEDDEFAYLKHTWASSLSVLQEDRSTLVIHPTYLLTKVRYFGRISDFDALKVTTKMEKYLRAGAY